MDLSDVAHTNDLAARAASLSVPQSHLASPPEPLLTSSQTELSGVHDFRPSPSSTSAWVTPPWWVFLIFGVVVICIAVAVFAITSRCDCEPKRVRFQDNHTPEHRDTKHADKPFVSPATLSDLKSTIFVLSWQGNVAPTQTLKVHFLLTSHPYSTFSCTAQTLFGSHGRVRVTLPKGAYTIRTVFGDGTQSVCEQTPDGGLITLTETTLHCQILREHVAAVDAPIGACAQDK